MNVFDTLRRYGRDENFEGDPTNQRFAPTDAPPGSVRKIEVMRRRALHGCPLWHPLDAEFADAETKIQHNKTGVANPSKQVVCASFQRRKAPAE